MRESEWPLVSGGEDSGFEDLGFQSLWCGVEGLGFWEALHPIN